MGIQIQFGSKKKDKNKPSLLTRINFKLVLFLIIIGTILFYPELFLNGLGFVIEQLTNNFIP